MNPRTPQHTQEACQAAESPAVAPSVQKASHALPDTFRAQAQAPSVDGLRSFASGAAAVRDYEQPPVDLGAETPLRQIDTPEFKLSVVELPPRRLVVFGPGERLTPWDEMHIAVAEDDELSDAVITYVQENFLWSQRPDLRDKLTGIIQSGPSVSKPLYRAEEHGDGSPESGQRGFRSWTAAKDTAFFLGRHMCHPNFAIRATNGAPVKALSIDDFAYWRGRALGTAMCSGQQAEYLVLDSTVPREALAVDARWTLSP